MLSLGLDIGGANTKAVLFDGREIEKHWYRYIPLWEDWNELKEFLEELRESLNPQVIGVTMTGELSDVFDSKKEGVKKITHKLEKIFSNSDVYYFSSNGEFLSKKEALDSPYKLSASNWVSSAFLVGREYTNCLLVDVGSTTTDITSVRKGRPDPMGWTDYERLETKELVYTGILRTPPPFLGSKISVNGREIGVSAEYFTNMADVYRVLDMLDEEDYTCETPDGRGKNKKDCMKRIARLFCSDLEEIGESFLKKVAQSFHEKQVSLVREAIGEVAKLHGIGKETPIIVTGIGSKILASKAAKKTSFDRVGDIANIYGRTAAVMTPAYSVGLLVSEEVCF